MNETDPIQQSLLSWAMSALGPIYIVLLPLSALVSFVAVLVLLLRGKGPMAAASVLLFVHIPLLIGIFAAIQGMISSYSVIAMSPSAPKPSEIAVGVSTSLFAPVVALLLMAPSYVFAAFGTFVRAVFADRTRAAGGTDP